MSASDAIEFILVGASAVQIGTANFIDPGICEKIIAEMSQYLDRHNLKSFDEIRGII